MTINRTTFMESLAAESPPPGLSAALEALWYDAHDNWGTAHERAQAQEDRDGAWVHGYLHRREGDDANAGYWYRRAGRPFPSASLAEEWKTIVAELLGE